ncbi:MAG: acetyl-CoA carboxylase, biotin carboxyl carrier protein [Planctomycetes bacterium RBG_13_46_10]|nr:MAG: acetyl-CoA carboxylase, biotin carboxyl carrier protein [Planctomycetes bacterium RBG_13_46_10]
MAQKDDDIQKIKEIIEIMEKNGLVEVEIKHGDDKIFLKRHVPQPPAPAVAMMHRPESLVSPLNTVIPESLPATATPSAAPKQENLEEIKSPIVGTLYAKPSPDSEPYVEIGTHVEPQMVLCIIEAMKVMNEIKAENSGTIAEVLVTNGQAVEYGQVIFRIKPD